MCAAGIKTHSGLIIKWKVSVFGINLVRIFPHLYWMRKDTEYLSVFSPNAGKCGPEQLRIQALFTQWALRYLGGADYASDDL